MDYQAGLTKRLEDTQALRAVNTQAITQTATIRKLAMRSNPVNADTIKWLVRTLTEALQFKETVFELWIDDDTEKLQKIQETGQIPVTPGPEPQLDMNLPAKAGMSTHIQDEPTPGEIAEAAEELEPDIQEGDVMETVPAEPEPEGMDKVLAILDAK